jgi:UDP-N-acetylglucosamine 2-epimerase
VQHAKSFITFTVGNNEELIISGIPYLTTFVNTEKPETIARGKHIL